MGKLGLKPVKRFVGIRDDDFIHTCPTGLQGGARSSSVAIMPTRLDQEFAQVGIPRFRYPSLATLRPAGVLARDQAQIGHE